MPRVIRQALGDRIRRDATLRKLVGDLRAALEIPISYAGPLGHREADSDWEVGPLTARLWSDAAGRRLYARFQQTLFEAAANGPATARCESGLTEAAVPLRAAGQTLGYLVAGGFLAAPLDVPAANRARHLLHRSGVELRAPELEELLGRSPVLSAARQVAIVQVLQIAAEHLTAKIMERLVEPEATVPPLVDKACRLVHAEFAQPLVIPEIARRLGSSEGHLSRTFHRVTGLRIVEYVARFRAERARALLRETEKPIIEIAFACGFQSVSQFNRVFRAQFGTRPRDARAEARGASVAAAGRTA